MNFISMEFLVFFPMILLLCRKLSGRARLIVLLTASYLLYMGGISWTGLLLFFSTAVSWLLARRIERAADLRKKRGWLAAALIYCVGCLCFFKREDFLVPGISFYMFQALSYVLDVYSQRAACEKSFGYYALYVSFFPQLAAGPIERAQDLLPQLKNAAAGTVKQLLDGFWLILRGFFKKLVAADQLSGYAAIVYEAPGQAGGLAVIAAAVFFAVQIYCDFSGYTDIARGTARMLGISLRENFDHPYHAGNIQEFWRRWHMSLTQWFTDYLYIPLGGSRRGIFYSCRNIMLVFAVSGLWHGLSWHFLVWGLLHGACLCVYSIFRAEGRHTDWKICRILGRFATFTFVCFAWIFFRAGSLADAGILLRQIFFHLLDDSAAQILRIFQIQKLDLLRLFLAFFCLWMMDGMPDELPDPSGRIKTSGQAAFAALVSFFIVTVSLLSWLALAADHGGNVFLYFSF